MRILGSVTPDISRDLKPFLVVGTDLQLSAGCTQEKATLPRPDLELSKGVYLRAHAKHFCSDLR